uniref:Secreted protein n=1 Tax=Schistocephalus solidus TaxID=70667 RepID=A0A0X3NHF2_SCHSO
MGDTANVAMKCHMACCLIMLSTFCRTPYKVPAYYRWPFVKCQRVLVLEQRNRHLRPLREFSTRTPERRAFVFPCSTQIYRVVVRMHPHNRSFTVPFLSKNSKCFHQDGGQ